jgi:hypothetical protein
MKYSNFKKNFLKFMLVSIQHLSKNIQCRWHRNYERLTYEIIRNANLMQQGNFINVFLADGAVHGTIRTAHTTYAAALTNTIYPNTRRRKP